jgi:signal transduction histidine kinase/Na+/proline symporter
MSAYMIILITGMYLGILFFIAQWGKNAGRAFLEKHSAIFYAMGICVYATAWTFYGSIGRAATHGLDFLAIYLGPILFLPVWWTVMRKIIRISKAQHLNSLADFITARYGKSWSLALLTTVLVVMAITPYLALQIKAISSSANVLLNDTKAAPIDIDLASTILLFVFALFYGTRFAFDPKQRDGLIATIAFESSVKVIAAFIGGAIIVYTYFDGPSAIYQESSAAGLSNLLSVQSSSDWMLMLIISGFAFFLLPRQFQMAVVSNKQEKDLRTAVWLVPLFLLLMNWWVVPIALGGNLRLPAGSNPDYFFLDLALNASPVMAGLVFLGGLAASTSMIIVSSSAVASMISNSMIMPLFLNKRWGRKESINPVISQRIGLLVVFALAFSYHALIVQKESLVSIGMISFIGIAQLAPGFLAALYWRQATSKGVLAGLSVGFVLWLTAFGVPQWLGSRSDELLLFNLFEQWSPLANISFISLGLNALVMSGISLMDSPSRLEKNQAEIFYNILNIEPSLYDNSNITSGKITYERLEKLLFRYLPDELVSETLFKRYTINRIKPKPFEPVPAHLVSYAERLLTQMMGPATARIALHKEFESETIDQFDIQDIIKETRETKQLNTALKEKTDRLAKLTGELTRANEQLHSMGKLKDDFLYTVTHELRSPLTAIRAQIELMRDEEDMPKKVRDQFLDATINECVRLTALISNVLDIEKFESGNQQLSLSKVDLRNTLGTILDTQLLVAEQEGVSVEIDGPEQVWTLADEKRITQVIINLLSNAIKYADREVKVCFKENEKNWLVHVVDDGPGVPQDAVPHLFKKFYQSDDQTVKKRVGTGLGLAISENIIKAHKGTIALTSNTPEGNTTFTFTISKYGN